MTSRHSCKQSGCNQPATDRCFECGAWHCATHLTHIQVPTAEATFAEVVCAACLQEHIKTPDAYGTVIVDLPPASTTATTFA